MELVYLWVENYKNIKQQGFNFSPRFECEYNKATKELTIDENKNYLENFFGKNINITAIIGENGSGKSSLQEILSLFSWQGFVKQKNKSFILYKQNNKLCILNDYYKNLKDNKSSLREFIKFNNNSKVVCRKSFSSRDEFKTTLFTNCITNSLKNSQLKNISNSNNFHNGIQPEEIMMPLNEEAEVFNQKFQYLLKKDINFFNFINENFIFDSYKFELHISELGAHISTDEIFKDILDLSESDSLIFPDATKKNSKEFFYRFLALFVISQSGGIRWYDDIEEPLSSEKVDEFIQKNIIDLVKKEFQSQEFSTSSYEKVIDICFKALLPSFARLEDEVEEEFNRDMFSVDNIEKLLLDYTYTNDNVWESNIFTMQSSNIKDKLKSPLLNKLLKSNILRCNFLNLKNKDYNFLNLSSGEQQYLKLFTDFAYTSYKIYENTPYLMMFDEVELSLHPSWQKKVLTHLLYIYNKIAKSNKNLSQVHLVFTSHSPFILSDIPKENVIFLEKGRQVYPFINKQTFGANIHTLLSHGFFMQDGLMGEFAKSKITKIINFHNKVENNKDNRSKTKEIKKEYEDKEENKASIKESFQYIQSIIGEDYLKQVIKNHIIEIEKILYENDFIDNEIQRAKEELLKLEAIKDAQY